MTDLSDEVRRAQRAKLLLQDEVFLEAVQKIERSLLDGIERSAFTDDKTREKLCQSFTLLRTLVREIHTVMETGELAQQQISLLERAKSFIKAA
jgi:hypothetical protein